MLKEGGDFIVVAPNYTKAMEIANELQIPPLRRILTRFDSLSRHFVARSGLRVITTSIGPWVRDERVLEVGVYDGKH